MGRRTQQRRRRRQEELRALRHDEREFRRRWLVRVDAWCTSLRDAPDCADPHGNPTPKARSIIDSVLQELSEIGETGDSPLSGETRTRLEAACRAGLERRAATTARPLQDHSLDVTIVPAPVRGKSA